MIFDISCSDITPESRKAWKQYQEPTHNNTQRSTIDLEYNLTEPHANSQTSGSLLMSKRHTPTTKHRYKKECSQRSGPSLKGAIPDAPETGDAKCDKSIQ